MILAKYLKCLSPSNEKLMEQVGASLLEAYKTRIFEEGKDASGGEIGSPPVVKDASERDGVYSKAYAKKRRKAGKRVDKKTLDLGGAFKDSIQFEVTKEGLNIGFETGKAALLAERQELQTGKEIFSPKIELVSLSDLVKDIIRKTLEECSKIR